jgi:hypothetical protein
MNPTQDILNHIAVGQTELIELLWRVWTLTDWLNAGHTLPDAPGRSPAHDSEITFLPPSTPLEGVEPLHVVRQDQD